MQNYFRVQHKGYTFEQMKSHVSGNGAGDGYERGLAVSASPDGIDGGSRFGGAWDAMNPDDDLVILNGSVIERLYDGILIDPTNEVARFTIAEWEQKIRDGSAYDYETL